MRLVVPRAFYFRSTQEVMLQAFYFRSMWKVALASEFGDGSVWFFVENKILG